MNSPQIAIEYFCETGSGTTPSRDNADEYYGGGIPWVKSGELKDNVIYKTEETVTEAALHKTALRLAPPGAILVAMYGATVGRVAQLGIPATTNQAICHIVPDAHKVDGRYLFHALRAKLPEFLNGRVGGAQPNISQQIIRRTKIMLPPLAEQRRIAAILDAADSLRAKRRAALAKLDQLAQSIFIEMFGDPIANDRNWPLAIVSDFVAGFASGKNLIATDDQELSKFRVLKVSSVSSFEFRPEESKNLPIDYTPPPNHLVKVGDLLFSRANTSELIGATAMVYQTPPNHVLPDKIWRFLWHQKPRVDPHFVWFLFRHNSFRHEIAKRGTGTSGSMKNISQENVLSITTIFPPLAQQQHFSTRVAAILALKNKHKTALSTSNNLFSSLQHRAFRGEL